MFILSYQIVSDYWVVPNYDILVYFQTYLTLFCGLKKKCFTLFCFANPHDFSHCFTYVVFLVLSRWLWNTFIWKKMWKVPLIVQGPTINWFQWKLTTKLEFWRWNQRFLFSRYKLSADFEGESWGWDWKLWYYKRPSETWFSTEKVW